MTTAKDEGQRLQVGIAGAGWVAGARHIPAFKRDPRVEVVAIYDRYPERAAAYSRRFGIAHACSDLDQFYSHQLDVVSVCTSPWTHAKLTIESLRRGCHVLCEKPMALNSAEAEAMVAAAERAERQLCISHNFLYSRSMMRAKAMMARGEVGPIRHVMGIQSSNPNRRLPEWYPKLPGGLFFDESPHMIYLLQHFLGELSIEHVRSQLAPPDSPQPIETIEVLLRGSHAATASLTMTFVAPVSEWFLVVVGERRVLTLDIFRDILTVMKPDGRHSLRDVVAGSVSVYAQQALGFISTGGHFLTNQQRFGQDTVTSMFLDTIVSNSPPPSTLGQALRVLRVMEGILDHIPGLADRESPPTRRAGAQQYLRSEEGAA